MDEFIAAGGVHPNDVERFKEFFNPFILKTKVVDKWPRVFYRRLIDGEYKEDNTIPNDNKENINMNSTLFSDSKKVCMEVIPMDNYSSEDPIVLIIVKEIGDYTKDYQDQVVNQIIDKIIKAGV